jgi:4-amino-4-deoxy-L-arabinose transferase-like glycosyltransferase
MTLQVDWARWARGWRGPALAALVAVAGGLPGLIAVPPLDRDESRFAQATAQMLETRDFTVIRFQEQPRFKKPVGIHWLQAASVSLVSNTEDREIWAYRIPSLLGAMLAAAACAWGAKAFFGEGPGLLAGAMLGATLMLSTEAFIAKTDAVLAGCTTLALAALGRLYAEANCGPSVGKRAWLFFWAPMAIGILDKGPITPMVAGLAILALLALDRRADWLKRLNAYWGLILVAAVVGPWAGAVTVATDGAFWTSAITGDLAPKLAGGQETHGAPPGYHTLLAPLLLFPMTLMLPAAATTAWRRWREPGVKFALCWLIPAWVVFEATPTKLVHYTLPTYGAIAWLAAAALAEPLGPRVRWIGAVLSGLFGVLLAGACAYLVKTYGDASDLPEAAISALLLAAAGLGGAWLLVRRAPAAAVTAAVGLGVAGHGALAAGLAPRLLPLWLSQRVERVMERAQLLPEQGIADAPVAVSGYAEPSLVFLVGTETEEATPQEAAEAISEHRPAVVEARQAPAFAAALAKDALKAHLVATVKGLDYSTGKKMALGVYESAMPAPAGPPASSGGQP